MIINNAVPDKDGGLQHKQDLFVRYAKTVFPNNTRLTRKEVIILAGPPVKGQGPNNIYGWQGWPEWLTGGQKYRAGSGLFDLPCPNPKYDHLYPNGIDLASIPELSKINAAAPKAPRTPRAKKPAAGTPAPMVEVRPNDANTVYYTKPVEIAVGEVPVQSVTTETDEDDLDNMDDLINGEPFTDDDVMKALKELGATVRVNRD